MIEVYKVHPRNVVVVQSRAEMNFDVVDEYAEAMKQGGEFPPCKALHDHATQTTFIWDGAHRTAAAEKAGVELLIETDAGNREKAEWLALTANAEHGLRRTQKDIQRIVIHALKHPNAAKLSNAQIARHCRVNDKTVAKYREQLEASSEIPKMEERTVERGGKTYTQKVNRIGKSRSRTAVTPKTVCMFCHRKDVQIYPAGRSNTGICAECCKQAATVLLPEE